MAINKHEVVRTHWSRAVHNILRRGHLLIIMVCYAMIIINVTGICYVEHDMMLHGTVVQSCDTGIMCGTTQYTRTTGDQGGWVQTRTGTSVHQAALCVSQSLSG